MIALLVLHVAVQRAGARQVIDRSHQHRDEVHPTLRVEVQLDHEQDRP